MADNRPLRRRAALAGVTAIVLGLTGAAVTPGPVQADPPAHSTLVSDVPSRDTPNITDGTVFSIFDAGSKVIVGGSFTTVRNRGSDVEISRPYVLAFDKATGDVENAFAPVVEDEVDEIIAGPTPGTVYLAGRFNTVNGVNRRKVALVNVTDGSLVTTFRGPAFNGAVNDVVLIGGRLLVAGIFTTAGAANPRGGLASLDASTGTLDSFLTTNLTGHHNFDGTSGAEAGVGPDRIAVSPDGTQAVVIGNFKYADGVLHDQVVKLNLGAAAATVEDWNTDRFTPRCRWQAFDSYVRDVTYSPDGSFFAIATTGASFAGTLCDAASRWESGATGPAQQPTWVAYSGGDTLLSVAITEQAVYVGGHFRWLNNTGAANSAYPGAIARPSIAALDPASGLPVSWNPGRHPRGYGVTRLLPTADGLWLGYDTDWIGAFEHQRMRIAFFPLAGGAAPHPTNVAALPGKVYQAGSITAAPANDIRVGTYDGATSAGALTPVANPDGTSWSSARGGFWVGGTLFYGMGGSLRRRTFDGTTFGAPSVVDPYHDAEWDAVVTGSGPEGQTYTGSNSNFYGEINNVTGMFYSAGRIFYTLSYSNGLYWRWFNPDSGAVGADRFAVSGASTFFWGGGLFQTSGKIYMVNRLNGNLSAATWTGSAPSGSWNTLSGPSIDGRDWRSRATFIGP